MKDTFAFNHNTARIASFDHAVVIGSSIAGLTAARVLADHFARVTVIDRDQLPETPQFRQGLPQARHAHTLPLRGQALLEQLFPGLVAELLANGAVSIKPDSEMAFFIAGSWHQLRRHAGNLFIACSRPLLDTIIYQRLIRQPAVQIIQVEEVTGLTVDADGRQVTGVRLRQRGPAPAESHLPADLVVDASGRDSRAPQWLASVGYTPPAETTVNALVGYSTRFYRQPADFPDSWKTLYIKPSPANSTRGGMIIPLEGDRWQVTVVGMAGDYPPTDEAGFMAFAQSLPTPRLYEAIQAAEPLTQPCGYRRTESRVRHYDRLPRSLEGFLVAGDAAYALNPIYAQGMTAAALGSLALADCLAVQRQHSAGSITGLARAFQHQLSQALAETWDMVTNQDQHWPSTRISEQTRSSQVSPAPISSGLAYQ